MCASFKFLCHEAILLTQFTVMLSPPVVECVPPQSSLCSLASRRDREDVECVKEATPWWGDGSDNTRDIMLWAVEERGAQQLRIYCFSALHMTSYVK